MRLLIARAALSVALAALSAPSVVQAQCPGGRCARPGWVQEARADGERLPRLRALGRGAGRWATAVGRILPPWRK